MAEATVSFYQRGETRYCTGRLCEWLPGGRAVVEDEDGQRREGLVVPDHLAALAGGAVTEA